MDLFGRKPVKVSKKTKKLAEQFIIENPDHPVSTALLKSTAKTQPFGRIKTNTLVKAQLGRMKKKRLYPFVGR